MMKQINKVLMTLLALAMVITFGATEVTAGGCASNADGEGGIQVDPTARGTKYEGPLTIYYGEADETGGYTLSIFLRLRKGSTLYSFGGQAYALSEDIQDVQYAVEAFFEGTVMQLLYPGQDPPSAALKSIDQVVDESITENPDPDRLTFNIMDIVLAVED